jgi:glycosyltransferase involved in cell wall biosynthesis
LSTRELPPRIGINAVFLRPRMGGLETYINALVPEIVRLAPSLRITVFCGPQGVQQLRDQPWSSEVCLATHPLLGRPGLKAASELTLLGPLASRRVDLLNSVAMTGPLRTRAVHVVMIHDLTWIIAPDPGDAATNALWRIAVPPVARRAARIITLSTAAAEDIDRYLHVARDRIDIVPPGPGVAASAEPTPEGVLRERLGLGHGPLILTVSAKRRHKNLTRLLEAMRLVTQRHPDAVIALPGNPTPHEQELKALAADLGIARNVLFASYVDAADLEGMYRAASCFAFASLNEGFGLPVLEAMRRGVPVACSRASSLPEVAGDAAEYFDPLDVRDMALALSKLLDDRGHAAELGKAGLGRAARFSWSSTAEGTLEAWSRAWHDRAAGPF